MNKEAEWGKVRCCISVSCHDPVDFRVSQFRRCQWIQDNCWVIDVKNDPMFEDAVEDASQESVRRSWAVALADDTNADGDDSSSEMMEVN